MTSRTRSPARWIVTLALVVGAGCAPALAWREFVPEGTDISVSFPCRPDRQMRPITLAGTKTRMQMLACSAGDATFALAFVDIADPTLVGAALSELRDVAVRNLQGAPPQVSALQIKGMTPNEQAGRASIAGHLPDGAVVREQAAFFVRGLRVYQATVIGAEPSQQAVDIFIAALKFVG